MELHNAGDDYSLSVSSSRRPRNCLWILIVIYLLSLYANYHCEFYSCYITGQFIFIQFYVNYFCSLSFRVVQRTHCPSRRFLVAIQCKCAIFYLSFSSTHILFFVVASAASALCTSLLLFSNYLLLLYKYYFTKVSVYYYYYYHYSMLLDPSPGKTTAAKGNCRKLIYKLLFHRVNGYRRDVN